MALINEVDVYNWVPQNQGKEHVVSEAIAQAQSIADEYCGHALESALHDECHDVEVWQRHIVLRHTPVTAVAAVYEDAQAASPRPLDSDDYTLDASAGVLTRRGSKWHPGTQAVRVQFTAGYGTGTCPQALKRALLQLVAWLLEFSGNVGVSQESVDGYRVVSEAMDGPVPESIGRMLQPYRRSVYG